MTRLYSPGLPIRVAADDEGRPKALVWAGQTRRVVSIEDVREPSLDWWSVGGTVHRVYFIVFTQDGMLCEVYRDVEGGEAVDAGGWALSRVWD